MLQEKARANETVTRTFRQTISSLSHSHLLSPLTLLSSSSATRVCPQPCGALCCTASPAGASEENERRRSEDERAEARTISVEDDEEDADAETQPEAEGEAAEARVEKKGDEFRAARAGAATTGKTRRNMVLW